VKKASPELIFVGLILFGVGISGWFYGIHWKQVADGNKFSGEEKLIIQLQDQIDALSEENQKLAGEIRKLTPKEVDSSSPPDLTNPTYPAQAPSDSQTAPESSDSETVVLPQ